MDYRKSLEIELIGRFKVILKELPYFCKDFFLSISQTTSIKTRLGYAYDLRTFFMFLSQEIDMFSNKEITSFTVNDMEKINYKIIDIFLDYLTYYQKEIKLKDKINTSSYTNSENGKSRKLSAVRRLFSYLYKVGLVPSNPAELVDAPKIHEKNIICLEPNEVAKLLDLIEDGSNLTKNQKKYHQYTKLRDFAIVTLLLGTGMRVSECVGVDISHLDFSVNGVKVIRKGGNESILYFGDEVYNALSNYLIEREKIIALDGHREALFLSMQKKRINVKTVQNLVKKYAGIVIPLKKISPHKLRSTYGTNLYEETGDIYLVADALGHSDVNTTKKHYARMSDKNRRRAGRVIKLR